MQDTNWWENKKISKLQKGSRHNQKQIVLPQCTMQENGRRPNLGGNYKMFFKENSYGSVKYLNW